MLFVLYCVPAINIKANNMSQNPEKGEEQPREKAAQRLKRKKIREAFKLGNFDQNIMLAAFKKYYSWKEKRPINIPVQQLKPDDREPAFSIALHCGTKNGCNQVFQDYSKTAVLRNKMNAKNKTTNNFQKLLTEQPNSRSQDDSKRLTFIDFKTKRKQKDSFFSYPDVKSMQFAAKEEAKRVKTEPKTYKTSFRKTGVPRQLSTLKEMIRKLPSVRLPQSLSNPQRHQQINIGLFNSCYMNNSYLKNQSQFNQTLMQSQQEQFQISPQERRSLFRKSKTQSIRGYIQQLNEVISFADELIHEEDERYSQMDQLYFKLPRNPRQTHKTLSPDHLINHRKYWPQYPRYTINTQLKKQDQGIAKFFSNFCYSDPKLNDQLQSIVDAIKQDLSNQERQMNKQIAQSEKNSIQHRYKYKMSIERENYKRNVKSFLKCKKEYRIQRRRQEVRANGITRIKKSQPIEKMVKVVQQQDESG